MSTMPSSPRRVVSGGGDSRVVVQESISSGPSSFSQFHRSHVTFVDKTLGIEAFLRNPGSHHLILRPRRCGKSHTLSMIRPAEHNRLVSKHFHQYPVLYIDLKDVYGITFQEMLTSFDSKILLILENLSNPCSDLMDSDFCKTLRGPGAVRERRYHALQIMSQELWRVYQVPVVVLVDEYDAPMHSAIEHGYSREAHDFFSVVFGSLLKNNDAVCASMMVGICKLAKPGWLSSLDNVKTFPLHAKDGRYARFFLFTEEEVKILRNESGSDLSLELLQQHYNGYAARCDSGLVKLYNPLSVVEALVHNKISNYWVETGHPPLTKNLWCNSEVFHVKIVPLVAGNRVKFEIDELVDCSSLNTIPYSGLWALLFYTGYLSIDSFLDYSEDRYALRIPNREVTSQWREWAKDYFGGWLTSINAAEEGSTDEDVDEEEDSEA